MKSIYDNITFIPTPSQSEILHAIDDVLVADFKNKCDNISWNYIYNFRSLEWATSRRSGKTTLLNRLVDYFPNSVLFTNTPTMLKRNQHRWQTDSIRGRTFDYIFIDEIDIDLRSFAIHQPKLIVRLYTPK
jgi:hypothetical protein